ncbi:MAG: chromosome segregation protein SMC [Acidimicrobiales bacterium]
MFLKSLTLKGFKSFADPATLYFEPGVTVVVGPNGSGKSNVVDAVAWVLGAQGPRTVRSSRMEDVIFAGSADRPALGRAEVSLSIDNRAGRLPGGLAEITITRTLFRSGDSEYAINGQPCRLLDVQELLSDSGVGRQQHVIVGQGQLDHVLNARPEDRRAVIEEAAGVLKHRRRRERAERRLAAAEENLDRLADLLREVRRQMRPLERQAAAARSHAALAEELKALRMYVVGRDLSALAQRRSAAASERDRLRTEEHQVGRSIAELDVAADSVAAELSAQREEDFVQSLTRAQALGERCRGVAGVLAERRRSLVRALEAAADVDVVSTLEADAARLEQQLTSLEDEERAVTPEADELATRSRQLDEERRAFDDQIRLRGDGRAVEEAHAVTAARLPSAREAISREHDALQRLESRLATVEEGRAARRHELEKLAADLATTRSDGHDAEGNVAITAAAEQRAADALGVAESALRDAEARRHRLEARAEALLRASAERSGSAGAEVLAGVPGVVGVLSSLVSVDSGYEGAFEAALGALHAAVVVDGADSARTALDRLGRGDIAGAVLALGSVRAPGTALPVHGGALAPLIEKVRVPCGELGDMVRSLLADVVVAGDWRQALDAALSYPESVVVTPAGDRFSPQGWALRAGGAQAARRAALQVQEQALEAAATTESLAAELLQARAQADAARTAATDANQRVERHGERERSLNAERARIEAELLVLDDEWTESMHQRSAVADRLDADRRQLAELEAELARTKQDAEVALTHRQAAEQQRRELDRRSAEIATARHELDLHVAALVERRNVLVARSAEVERRLAGHATERSQAEERRRRIETDIVAVDRLVSLVGAIAQRAGRLLEQLQELRARQVDEVRARGARLEALRHERAEADRRLAATRDRLQTLELELAESNIRHESALEALRRELGVDPAQAMAASCPELPEGVTADARAASLEQEITALGPVNPLALEELGALEERHRFLEEQVDDVRRSRRELQQLIHEVDDEIMRVFAEAFTDVNRHFQTLVSTLFPGGSGRLVLTDPEDLLDTGVEVEARPAGKNVRKLSLLSGGERSLVALAFLFAVFRSRPSPFYLMDEVEAALDDVNLHRFLDLLHEFREEAQLIIVSHQKRTMEAADALYGVTMTPGGSSKVVSQKVRQAPAGDPASAPASA